MGCGCNKKKEKDNKELINRAKKNIQKKTSLTTPPITSPLIVPNKKPMIKIKK